MGDNFHPTSRYPASHAINASSTSTTIRTTYFPEGYNIDPWPNVTDQDEVMKLWVVNQLMGETEKGDTMILARVTGPADTPANPDWHRIELWTGILYGNDGKVKALIPALFSVKHDGVFTEYDYTGLVGETTADVEAEYREVTRDGDIDQAVREWFLRK